MSNAPGGVSSTGAPGSLNQFTQAASSTSRPQPKQPFAIAGSIASSSVTGDEFTSDMRDRQARGKDPYHSGDGSDDSSLSDHGSGLRLGKGRPERVDFAQTERRRQAVAFLDDPELLTSYCQAKDISMAEARLHFTAMLCGYD
ncbi:hypothetical protein C8A05DRAFT_30037 [Staphylotrichum tortipilum]|uniref:Uncharacterized protein n=1 Tax=Staphylotrichum tortipilum TaxID=2831512 RepID=A0AAN6MS47_9PEZI|nr:hypothetical protein C8A05DRAFT_30037 [Staphylotrichum longicolle]